MSIQCVANLKQAIFVKIVLENKILSDAFVAVLGGQMQAGADRAVSDSTIGYGYS